jgi:hypothetical protein
MRSQLLASISKTNAYLVNDLRNAIAGEMGAITYQNVNMKANSKGLYLDKTKFD